MWGIGSVFEIVFKGTSRAVRRFGAVRFSDGDGERMELVEEAGVAFRRVLGECLLGERDERLIAFAAGFNGGELMALGYAAEILIGYGHGMAESVEQDGIGSFRADARKCEKPAAKGCGWNCGEAVQ